ncbi:MAG: right-handed parallel beta-helix repeat-containing protein [Patescibacteria group bacterium]|nr:right-handed parallel beta-helix repeat-containing protein [Patescibacteria group bacterium]
MTRCVTFLLAVALTTSVPLLPAAEQQGTDGLLLYVSTTGNDAWTGRSPKPNEAGTDGPFATLEQARDRIRQLKSSDGLPVGGVTVALMPGRYERSEAFALTAEDAGSAASPIVYRAWPGGEVTICGSRTVTAWQPVTDPEVLDRLDASARGNVYQADLGSLGVETYGDLLHDAAWEVQWRHHRDDNQGEATQGDALAAQRHVQRTGTPVEPRLELFFNGQPMTLSRWPNEGFTHIDKALGETAFDVRGLPGRREGIFSCVDDRVGRWVNEKDALVRGYWYRDWVVQTQRIESIDLENRVIRLAEPYHNYGGYRDGMWFFGLNLLCEIDRPGEWMIDRGRGLLYFWPPSSLESGRAEVSVADGLFKLTNTAHITLRGFRLEAARGTAVRIHESDTCRVVGCTIRNVTNYGVTIVDGKDCAVVGCDITGTGGGGVFMAGGDREELIPAGHVVENCHIHHFARWDRTYRPGVLMTGVGLRASHNLIHHAPHSAIIYGGPLHQFDHNEIHNVCQESHDCGAIYGGRSWCMRGDLFLHNYLHHICGKDGGPCNGIYLDDANSGATIRGNVFHQVWRPVFVGGGRDTLVENNIFVDCPQAFHLDARYAPGNWAAQYGDPRIEKARETGVLNGVRFSEPPYGTRYPELASMLDDDPTWPKGNVVKGNIFWRGDGTNLRRTGWDRPAENKAYQVAWWHHIQKSAYALVTIENNMVDVDPRFVDEAAGDFRLREDSPAWTMGFQPIPFEKIGLYHDAYRASWPVSHNVDPLPEPAQRGDR